MKKEGRRQFLKGTLGMLGGAMTAQAARLFPELQAALGQAGNPTMPPVQLPEQLEVGELYGGFLLLPEDAAIPYFVKYPQQGIPIYCNPNEESVNGRFDPFAITESSIPLGSLERLTNFPIYILNKLPDSLYSDGATVIRYASGDIYEVSVHYNEYDSEFDENVTTVSLYARPHFPQPYPLWASESDEENGPNILLQKVEFLPSPGVYVNTEGGYVLHWIKQDILYIVMMESSSFFEDPQTLVNSLTMLV